MNQDSSLHQDQAQGQNRNRIMQFLKRPYLKRATFALLALFTFVTATFTHLPVAKGQAVAPFSCDGSFYISLDPTIQTPTNTRETLLNLLNLNQTAPYDLIGIGPTNLFEYNAIGYNIIDNFVYGIIPRGADQGTVYKIDRNGNTTQLTSGVAAALAAAGLTANGFIAGDFDDSGNYYVYSRGTGNGILVRIPVSGGLPGTPTISEVTGNPDLTDIAYNPVDGKLYGFNRGDPGTPNDDAMGYLDPALIGGTLPFNSIPNSTFPQRDPGDPVEPIALNIGAAFFDSQGNFFGYHNSGLLYRIDVGVNGNGSGQYTFLGGAADSRINDGTACPYVPIFEKSASPRNVAPGGIVTYTYRIINGSVLDLNNVQFVDTMSDGRTFIPDGVTLTLPNSPTVPLLPSPPAPLTPPPTLIFSEFNGISNGTMTINNLTIPARAITGNIPSVTTITAQVQIPNTIPDGRYLNQARLGGSFSGLASTFEVNSDDPITPLPPRPDQTAINVSQDFGARFRLVKRITNILRNGISLSGLAFDRFNDDLTTTDDNIIANAGLNPVGIANAGSDTQLQSSNTVEYTIYYLATGATPATNVRICDAIPVGTSFVSNSFGGDSGILLQQGTTSTAQTNAADGDLGQFFSPLTPVNNFTPPCPNASNPNGSVVVNLGDVPNTGTNSNGFLRFRVQVN